MTTSAYGAWESQGEVADGALQKVAGVHHQYATDRGVACLCGAYCGTNRAFTEHVIDQAAKALAEAHEYEYAVFNRDNRLISEPGWTGAECRHYAEPYAKKDFVVRRRRPAGEWEIDPEAGR